MPPLPPFVQYLGLEADADERAVKRAYARALKKIDQEREPQAFQALREAYEEALLWLRYREQDIVHGDAQAEADAAQEPAAGEREGHALAQQAREEPGDVAVAREQAGPAPTRADAADLIEPPGGDGAGADGQETGDTPDGQDPLLRLYFGGGAPGMPAAADVVDGAELQDARPDLLGKAVFEEFRAELARQTVNTEQLRQMLERYLDDARLLQLDAKEMFEWQVAHLLVDGWRPGHDLLFELARTMFHWEDARRLLRFGDLGRFLDNALRELAVLRIQDSSVREPEQEVLRQLRLWPAPRGADPDERVQLARRMADRYPHLMVVVVSGAHYRAWQAPPEASPEPQAAAGQGAADLAGGGWADSIWLWSLVLVCLIGLAVWAMSSRQDGLLASSGTVHRTPPPGSQLAAAVDRVVGMQPSRLGCDEASNIATLYGVGPNADLGAPFDRFILACDAGGQWPRVGDWDPIVTSARLREKRRNP